MRKHKEKNPIWTFQNEHGWAYVAYLDATDEGWYQSGFASREAAQLAAKTPKVGGRLVTEDDLYFISGPKNRAEIDAACEELPGLAEIIKPGVQ